MAMLDHISLSRKFMVLGFIALMMAAVPTALQVHKSVEEIQDAKLEARATPQSTELKPLKYASC